MATTKKEAEELGLTTYMTGKECRNGHDGPRYTTSGSCVECTAERGARRNRRKAPPKMREPGKMTMDDWAFIKELEEAEKETWSE